MLDFLNFANGISPTGVAPTNNQAMLGLGLSMMNPSRSQNEDFGSLLLRLGLSGMLKQNQFPQDNTQMKDPNYMQSPQAPSPGNQDISASPNIPIQSIVGPDILQRLKEAAEKAFPGDPVRQQEAITVAIHESGIVGDHMSGLAKQNNFFGIKAPGTAGTVNMGTNEFMNGQNQRVNASFGANATPQDSFNQFRDLMNKSRYKGVMAAQDPNAAFIELQRAGYATDPRYARNLSSVYKRNVAPLYS